MIESRLTLYLLLFPSHDAHIFSHFVFASPVTLLPTERHEMHASSKTEAVWILDKATSGRNRNSCNGPKATLGAISQSQMLADHSAFGN